MVWELLHTPADLSRWLSVIVDANVKSAGAADLPATKRLRAAHLRIAYALTDARPPASADVAVVNRAATPPPLMPRLKNGELELRPGSVEQALSTLARDVQDLVAGPLASRVRICAAADCGLLFVDASRPGRRRWCSMQWCGNRAKTRAYRAQFTGANAAGDEEG